MEGCNYLLAVDVDMNTVSGYEMSSWEQGYGDFLITPDATTLRRAPWLPSSAMVQCDLSWLDGTPVRQSPRQVLRAQVDEAQRLGFTALGGTELEFIVFRDSFQDAFDANYQGLTGSTRYNVDYSILGTSEDEPLMRDIRNAMYGAGLTVESSKGECNFGQHEIALPLRRGAADRGQPRGVQGRGEGAGGEARQVADLHGQVRRARGQLVPRAHEPAGHGRRDRVRRR